jgi:hypothetical protein
MAHKGRPSSDPARTYPDVPRYGVPHIQPVVDRAYSAGRRAKSGQEPGDTR